MRYDLYTFHKWLLTPILTYRPYGPTSFGLVPLLIPTDIICIGYTNMEDTLKELYLFFSFILASQ